jgi:hypothetical protein
LQVLQYAAKSKKIAYFPFGLYRVESTLIIPVGSTIVGEGWATITGDGNYFQDSNNPKPVVSVGNPGIVCATTLKGIYLFLNSFISRKVMLVLLKSRICDSQSLMSFPEP